MTNNALAPSSPYQENYLNATADIVVAGGAVGSSKSYVGLMRHLRWAEDPYYRGYCFRKNSTTLMKRGGLFEAAIDMYRKYDPKIKVGYKKQEIVFSSGAVVSFTHYERDSDSEKIRGLEISNGFYDEATDAEEDHIWMIISRLRTTKAKLKPSIWMTCNPNPDHWLREWVDWWLYPETHEKAGLPDPEKNGKTRWILRLSGVIYWGDTKEELIKKYGKPYLDNDHPEQVKPLSVQVLLGTIYDNPKLIEMNPSYLASLEALPEVRKQRDLYGNWNAREEGSTYYKREWVETITDFPERSNILQTVRAFDFAGTLKSELNPSPDYTASVRMSKTKDHMFVIEDVQRKRITFGNWMPFILECAATDPRNTTYYIPEDPNPAAKAATKLLARELTAAGLTVRIIRASTSKLDRFRPFSAMAFTGGVQIVEGCTNDPDNAKFYDNKTYHKELEAFTGKRKSGEAGHDDMVDATSDAYTALASRTTHLTGLAAGLQQASIDFKF